MVSETDPRCVLLKRPVADNVSVGGGVTVSVGVAVKPSVAVTVHDATDKDLAFVKVDDGDENQVAVAVGSCGRVCVGGRDSEISSVQVSVAAAVIVTSSV